MAGDLEATKSEILEHLLKEPLTLEAVKRVKANMIASGVAPSSLLSDTDYNEAIRYFANFYEGLLTAGDISARRGKSVEAREYYNSALDATGTTGKLRGYFQIQIFLEHK